MSKPAARLSLSALDLYLIMLCCTGLLKCLILPADLPACLVFACRTVATNLFELQEGKWVMTHHHGSPLMRFSR
jgi:hypothetical protein